MAEKEFHIPEESFAKNGRSYSNLSGDRFFKNLHKALARTDLSDEVKERIKKNHQEILKGHIKKALESVTIITVQIHLALVRKWLIIKKILTAPLRLCIFIFKIKISLSLS